MVNRNQVYEIRMSEWDAATTREEKREMILKFLEAGNPYCSFAFKNLHPKQPMSRKVFSPLFRCYGYCRFDDCPIRFTAVITGSSSLVINIDYTCNMVKHAVDERRSRYIRSTARQQLISSLEHQSPSTLYHKLFSTIPESELESGKRDKVGQSKMVLQKISSEGNLSKQKHSNLLQSLMMLREELNDDKSKKLGRYIQRINAFPLSITCITEEGIRLYHMLGHQSTLFLDATGTVVSLEKTNYNKPKMLYYALVLRHPKEGHAPIAVAEFLTQEHTVLAIAHFLESLRHYESILFGTHSMVQPSKFVVDRSITLLMSITKVYFQENVKSYYSRFYRIVTGCYESSDFDKGFVCACISHIMKSIKYDLKKLW